MWVPRHRRLAGADSSDDDGDLGGLASDGGVIRGAWEASADGTEWKHDFGLTYIRAGPAA